MPDINTLDPIFADALQKQPGEQAAFLDHACRGDAALRQRVEQMLVAHAQASSFLETPPSAIAIASRDVTEDYQPITERPGSHIGPYKLREQLGEGGMGTVFVAEQEQPIRR